MPGTKEELYEHLLLLLLSVRCLCDIQEMFKTFGPVNPAFRKKYVDI